VISTVSASFGDSRTLDPRKRVPLSLLAPQLASRDPRTSRAGRLATPRGSRG